MLFTPIPWQITELKFKAFKDVLWSFCELRSESFLYGSGL